MRAKQKSDDVRIKITRLMTKEKTFIPNLGIAVENILNQTGDYLNREGSSSITLSRLMNVVLSIFDVRALKPDEREAVSYLPWHVVGLCMGYHGAELTHEEVIEALSDRSNAPFSEIKENIRLAMNVYRSLTRRQGRENQS